MNLNLKPFEDFRNFSPSTGKQPGVSEDFKNKALLFTDFAIRCGNFSENVPWLFLLESTLKLIEVLCFAYAILIKKASSLNLGNTSN